MIRKTNSFIGEEKDFDFDILDYACNQRPDGVIVLEIYENTTSSRVLTF